MNDINTLRSVLFDTLNDLNNQDKKIDMDRIKAINEVAQTIINTAKVEASFLNYVGGKGTDFIPFNPLRINKE